MAYRSCPFLFPLVGACILVFCCGRTFRGDATLRPSRNWEGPYVRCDTDLEKGTADCSSRGLDDVPQNLSRDIKQLDLRSNNITFLLNSTFERYTLIFDLDLSYNDIRMIEQATFYPLKDLLKLDMSNNPNIVLPDRGLFRWAGKLVSLYVHSSNLKSLPNDILKWSTEVQDLELSSNKISSINFSSCYGGRKLVVSLLDNEIRHINAETFDFACQTLTLDLMGNPITSVDPDTVAPLNVENLYINDNQSSEVLRNITIWVSRSLVSKLFIRGANLSILSKDVFDPLRDYPLSFLELTVNNIKVLSPYVFSNLTRLSELSLSYNEITTIEPVFFEGMHKLRGLSLASNKIEHLNRHGQIWSLDLYELDLEDNLLAEVSPYTFLGLRNLTYINLMLNKRLAVVNITAFTGLHNIRNMNLSGCNIENIFLYTPMLYSLSLNENLADPSYLEYNIKSFENARSLVNLEMRNSKIYPALLVNGVKNMSLFGGMLKLVRLDLGENYFGFQSYLEPVIFEQLSALEDLSLDHCDISFFHPLVFAGLESLRHLNLMGNRITVLQYNLLEGLPQVVTIDLSNNLLEYLEETIFSNNSRLKDLSLASNKFAHLNYSTFQRIVSSLSSLDLSMNPIDCDCDLKWLPKLINGQVKLMNKEKTICSSSSLFPLRKKPLTDFDPTELCRLNIVALCMIPLVVVCLIVIVVLVYHNRWSLKNKLFLLKLAAIGYQEKRDARDHNDYEFDLNIIFYDEDEEWIRDQLRPALEEHLPQFQRNIFGDGDLVLGMHYLDSVDYVVTHSYKTIIVLSRASVSDRWFMLKFRTAMDHVSDTGTEFVVVVFLEDIPDEEIPFLARLYLSDGRPYLYWPDDMRGQEYFWNELSHHLTINLRTNDLIPNE